MVNTEQLKAAAKEMIKVMLLTEDDKSPIIIDDYNPKQLSEFIKDCIEEMLPTDKFSDETNVVIAEFKDSPEKEKEEDDEPLLKEEDVINPTPLIQEVEEAVKLKELKDLAKSNDEFKTIRGVLSSYKTAVDLKKVMVEMLAVDTEKETTISAETIIEDEIFETEEILSDLKDDVNKFVKVKEMKLDDIMVIKPFNALFHMDPIVLDSIINDMKTSGYDPAFPVILWEDVLLDGHTRLEAAKIVGLKAVPVEQKKFANEKEALDYAIHNQRDRRNITEAEILHCIELVDKPMTKEEAGAMKGKSNFEMKKASDEPTHKQTAKKLGVSASKVSDARTVLKDEKATEAVKTGKKTISGAAKEVRKANVIKTDVEEGLTRIESVVQVIRVLAGKKTNFVTLVEEADSLFSGNGGKSNMKHSTSAVYTALEVLIALKFVIPVKRGEIEGDLNISEILIDEN